MADTKISALPAGAPAQASDLIPVARAGANVSLMAQNLSALATIAAGSKTLCVDGNRTDVYVADGTVYRPFLTISAAVAQIIANGDNASYPYRIKIAAGTYVETVDLGNAAIYNLILDGQGVIVAPISGNALQSLANNSQFATARFYGLTCSGSVNFTDPTGGLMLQSGCWFIDCRFWGDVTLSHATMGTILNFYFWSCFSRTVNWTIINCQDVYFFNCDLQEWPNPVHQTTGGSFAISNTTGANLSFATFWGGQYYFSSITVGVRSQIDVYNGLVGGGGTITVNGTLRFRAGGLTVAAITVNSGGILTFSNGQTFSAPTNSGGTVNFSLTAGAAAYISPKFQSASFTGPTWTSGAGVPSGTPAIGSMYSRTDGGIGTSLYVYNGTAWAAIG